jgi:hypothetical protein
MSHASGILSFFHVFALCKYFNFYIFLFIKIEGLECAKSLYILITTTTTTTTTIISFSSSFSSSGYIVRPIDLV